jgi:hypothetical protein
MRGADYAMLFLGVAEAYLGFRSYQQKDMKAAFYALYWIALVVWCLGRQPS